MGVHDGSWHRLIKKLQLQKKTSRVIRTFYFHSHLNCKRFHKSFIQNAGCWKAHSQILWTLLRSWTFGNSPTSNHRCCKSQKSKERKGYEQEGRAIKFLCSKYVQRHNPNRANFSLS